MNAQELQTTWFTWALLISWVIFTILAFIRESVWIGTLLRRDDESASKGVKGVLRRGIPLTLIHLVWASAVLITLSVDAGDLICLWLVALFALGAGYVSIHVRSQSQ